MKIFRIATISTGLVLGAASLAFAQTQSAPAADPSAAQNAVVKSPSDTGPAPLAKGSNSFTMGEAQSRIQDAGYTDVSGLTKNADGLWQGQAMHNGQRVNVALDYKGTVASQ